jgi:hypothetical protein
MSDDLGVGLAEEIVLCELRNKIQKKIQELKELEEFLWAEGGIDALGWVLEEMAK